MEREKRREEEEGRRGGKKKSKLWALKQNGCTLLAPLSVCLSSLLYVNGEEGERDEERRRGEENRLEIHHQKKKLERS
jgi:hypothetical protein